MGTGQPNVNATSLKSLPFPLPPLNEQKRIVARIESLFEKTKVLKEKLEKTDKQIVSLNKSALNHVFSSSNHQEYKSNLNFLFDKFKLLYSDERNVKELKQAILQLAVMGKLVRQDPDDEPASVLLKRIKSEKARFIKEKKIKKEKPLPVIDESETPYELPRGWCWCRLGDMSNNIHYGYTASADSSLTEVRLLRITDIQNNQVNWQTVPGCIIATEKIDQYKLNDNDVLIARTGGTIGKSYFVKDIDVCAVFASYLIRVIPNHFNYPEFLKVFCNSGLYWKQLYAKSMGTGQPNVNATSLKSLPFPLPPLNEQKMIVEKVDKLIALCDGLEKGIVGMKECREKMSGVVLG
jgi:type I restriction enzyme S subunit